MKSAIFKFDVSLYYNASFGLYLVKMIKPTAMRKLITLITLIIFPIC